MARVWQVRGNIYYKSRYDIRWILFAPSLLQLHTPCNDIMLVAETTQRSNAEGASNFLTENDVHSG